jgi:hypothetical protein
MRFREKARVLIRDAMEADQDEGMVEVDPVVQGGPMAVRVFRRESRRKWSGVLWKCGPRWALVVAVVDSLRRCGTTWMFSIAIRGCRVILRRLAWPRW